MTKEKLGNSGCATVVVGILVALITGGIAVGYKIEWIGIGFYLGTIAAIYGFGKIVLSWFAPDEEEAARRRSEVLLAQAAADKEKREREERERVKREWEAGEPARRAAAAEKERQRREDEQRRAREAEEAKRSLQNARSKPPEDW